MRDVGKAVGCDEYCAEYIALFFVGFGSRKSLQELQLLQGASEGSFAGFQR